MCLTMTGMDKCMFVVFNRVNIVQADGEAYHLQPSISPFDDDKKNLLSLSVPYIATRHVKKAIC